MHQDGLFQVVIVDNDGGGCDGTTQISRHRKGRQGETSTLTV